jgi:predicted Zn-dependent peptidase
VIGSTRFIMPIAGAPARVTFPPVDREVLANGLRVWTIRHDTAPVVSIVLVVPVGSVHDPAALPGLTGVMADLLDEGSDRLDGIGLAEAFAGLGTELSVDVGPDVTTLSLTTLARFAEPALALIGELIRTPRLSDADLSRVREVRLTRLRQLRSSAAAVADRAFLAAVFGGHPYGHGTLGTTAALSRLTIDDVRECHRAGVQPAGATLVVAGDVDPEVVHQAAIRQLGGWEPPAGLRPPAAPPVAPDPGARVLVVHRSGAPQTEVRVGHLGPARQAAEYHTLVTLDALLGGQFSSRINQNLREARGLTYGARTAFDFRVHAGTFSCDTNVQGDATPLVVSEILAEFDAVGGARPVTSEELERAKSSLTRGYVRRFETSAHLAHSAARLATFALPEHTFDRFVPGVEAVTPEAISAAARRDVRATDAMVVLVGDATSWRDGLVFGRAVEDAQVEF